MTCSAAVVGAMGGLVGFGALEGTFTALPGVVPDAVFQFGGNVCLRAGTALHVFHAQVPAWRTQITTQPASVQLHHAALLALAGNEVWFYGSHVDRWSHVTLSTAPSALVASDDCGFVQDGTTLYGFGATGQVSAVANHPEWWKVLQRGGPALWTLVGEPGAASVLFVGDASAAIAVPPLGTV